MAAERVGFSRDQAILDFIKSKQSVRLIDLCREFDMGIDQMEIKLNKLITHGIVESHMLDDVPHYSVTNLTILN